MIQPWFWLPSHGTVLRFCSSCSAPLEGHPERRAAVAARHWQLPGAGGLIWDRQCCQDRAESGRGRRSKAGAADMFPQRQRGLGVLSLRQEWASGVGCLPRGAAGRCCAHGRFCPAGEKTREARAGSPTSKDGGWCLGPWARRGLRTASMQLPQGLFPHLGSAWATC